MEAQEVMDLYDLCWFEMEIFKNQPAQVHLPSLGHNPGGQFQEEEAASKPEEEVLRRVPTIITRSMSEQLSFKLSPKSAFSLSPDSVLSTPKLQTILSGKEITEEGDETSVPRQQPGTGRRKIPSRKGKRGNRSKSLSELEFEELKGFMDLGFVFSEEDKDSSLVSILPGLQRLGKNNDNTEDEDEKIGTNPAANESAISRPYLSEAWEGLDRRRARNPLANWRIPTLSNEIDMKDSLRLWAHTVASTVR